MSEKEEGIRWMFNYVHFLAESNLVSFITTLDYYEKLVYLILLLFNV